MALQNDGKIVVGGNFTSYNEQIRNYLARLNNNGSLDIIFDIGTGTNKKISKIFIQDNGKIIIGGDFTFYNGTERNRIARLNNDGSLDTTFNPGTGANGIIQAIILQDDGKILIGGCFTSYNDNKAYFISRLNKNGSIDTTFNSGYGASNYVNTIAIQKNGKIIIGGLFIFYNNVTRNHVARLNSDGTIDNTFDPGVGTNDAINSISIQNDENIIIGGNFTSYNQTGRNRIARLLNPSVNNVIMNYLSKNLKYVYPNPVKDVLILENKGNSENTKFEIFNSFGQKIYSGNFIDRTIIKTNEFIPGMYIIKI